MKKLNRKGFTLIELLAVIVIMAIIVVVTVPTIINTISDARVNSIWNLAVATANSYDTISAQDMVATNKVLEGYALSQTDWKCFDDVEHASTRAKLSTVFDLSSTDLVLSSESNNDNIPSGNEPTVTGNTCSAIRLKSNGSAEVLLVAKTGGKFAVSGKIVYALSSEANGHQ